MFEAVRTKLIGAWQEVRARGFVGLFFFELLVVTLGVLLAQEIADSSNRRGDVAAMEKAKARADLEMGDAAMVGRLWSALGPCIARELELIFHAARTSEPIDPELLKAPGTFTTAVMPLDARTKLLIRERYGDDAAYYYDRMERLANRLDSKADGLVDRWGQFHLLGVETGDANGADRAAIREITAIIHSDLTAVRSTAREIVSVGNRMKVQPKIFGEYGKFARNCDDYRAMGRRMFDRSSEGT